MNIKSVTPMRHQMIVVSSVALGLWRSGFCASSSRSLTSLGRSLRGSGELQVLPVATSSSAPFAVIRVQHLEEVLTRRFGWSGVCVSRLRF